MLYGDAGMAVVVVAQATGQHGWSSLESYRNGLQQLGASVDTMRPHGRWGASRLDDDGGLVARLHQGRRDVLVLCGFDWHSQPMHTDPRVRDALLAHAGPRIGIFQEHLAARWIRDDSNLARLFEEAALAACELLTHVACNHEDDVALLRSMGVRLPILYLPFCADLATFKRQRSMGQRDPRAFFRGKKLEFQSASPYADREAMVACLRETTKAVVEDLPAAALLDREGMSRQ